MSTDRDIPAGRPMAGHRSATSLALVFGSVMPTTFGAVLVWTAMGWVVDTYAALLLFLGALAAIVTPYAVGWLRSLVSVFLAVVLLRCLAEWIEPVWLVGLASVAFLAALVVVVRWSLRLGHARRPGDAKGWRDATGDTWPYPYA